MNEVIRISLLKWRNWQTRWTQNPVRLTPGVGSTPTFSTHSTHPRSMTSYKRDIMMRFILLTIFISFPTVIAIPQEKSEIILQDRFSEYLNGSNGFPRWQPVKGNWQIIDGRYHQKSVEYDCSSLLDTYMSAAFEFEITFEHIDGDLGVGFIFSSRERNNTQYAQMVRFDGNNVLLVGYFYNGEFTATSSVQTPTVTRSEPHILTLQVDPSRYLCSVLLDHQSILTDTPLRFPIGYIGIESSGGHVCFHEAVVRRLNNGSAVHSIPWIEHFTLHSERTFAVPREELGQVIMLDRNGNKISSIGTPAHEKGQLRRPHACAFLDDSTLIIADRGNNSIHKFSTNGKWYESTGWKGKYTGQFDDPQAIEVNNLRQIFVVDKYNNRIQVFDKDLQPVSQFGTDRLVFPTDISIDDSTICILNTGLSQIEIFQWNGTKASWRKTICYGGGEGHGIAVWKNRIYVSIFNEVRSYDTSGTRLKSFFGRSQNFILPQSIAIDRNGRLFIADYNYGRIICTNTDLLDPTPRVSYNDTPGVTISWESLDEARGSISYCDTEGHTAADSGDSKSNFHSIKLNHLQKVNRKYSYTFSPTLTTLPTLPANQPRYTFRPPPIPRSKLYARLPVVCLLFANIMDDSKPAPPDIPIPSLPESEIRRIEDQLADGVIFYWMHSGMRFFIDLETVVIREPLKRKDVYGSEWWYPPLDTVLEHYLRLNGKHIRNYGGVLYITCTQYYDTTRRHYALAGGGGGFTTGVGTGKGYGISWWDATKVNHNAGNNWLMVHEFNHQLDDIFLASGYPEYWFNHISPTIGTAATFGEHFDANAHILRIVPPEEWYDLAYTEVLAARDYDEDGIPDNDPRLPLDEARLYSDSTKTDSDNDGIADMDELLFSNWIREGWGESYGGKALFPMLNDTDSDKDGINDANDPLPCLPHMNEIRYGSRDTIHSWATLNDDKIRASLYASWNHDSLFFVLDTDSLTPIKVMIDGNNDGWFMGRENLLVTVTPQNESTVSTQLQIFNATDPAQWPFMDKNLPGTSLITSSVEKTATGYRTYLCVAHSDKLNLRYNAGTSIGLLIGFLRPFDGGNRRYVTLFEPNRFIEVTLR